MSIDCERCAQTWSGNVHRCEPRSAQTGTTTPEQEHHLIRHGTGHKHTCTSCGATIAEGDFDCEFDRDHDYQTCATCWSAQP